MRTHEVQSSADPVWDRDALHAPHQQADKPARVQMMFDAIARHYERINTLASLGQDGRWRRRAVRAAGVRRGDVVLDVCCGTGDMVRLFSQHRPAPARVIGLDFAAHMLAAGRFDGTRGAPIHVIRGDALHLPLADASVDVISCAFGVRNFGDVQAGLNEMGRVARPGARLVILEFSLPRSKLLRWAHGTYGDTILPWIAGLVGRDRTGAYRYLARSIQTFEPAEAMAARLANAGFADVRVTRMNLGGVALYRAVRRAT